MILPIKNLKRENFQAYAGDSGVDIAVPLSTPVYAAAAGRIVYSEQGHTPWTTPPDTPGSVLIQLDTPIVVNGENYYYHWYTHLSYRVFTVADGSSAVVRIKEGQEIGSTGLGNKVPHLHFGMLIRRAQQDGDFMPAMELQQYMIGLLNGSAVTEPAPTVPQSNVITLTHTKAFYKKGKAMTVVVDGVESEPETFTLDFVTRSDKAVSSKGIKEEEKMENAKNLITGSIKQEVSGMKLNVLNSVVNLLLRVTPTVLAALADGRIDQNEQKEIVSELGAGVAAIAGKQLTEEEAGKLFDAAVILIRLSK